MKTIPEEEDIAALEEEQIATTILCAKAYNAWWENQDSDELKEAYHVASDNASHAYKLWLDARNMRDAVETWELCKNEKDRMEIIMGLRVEECNLTLLQYFHNLLLSLWKEKDMFSAKYGMFGEDNWEGQIYRTLVANGVVKGHIATEGYEAGYAVGHDTKECDELIAEMIKYIFSTVNT